MSRAHTSKITALVVDDNRDAADTLDVLLKVMGHAASAAYDCESGIRLAVELCPDLAGRGEAALHGRRVSPVHH